MRINWAAIVEEQPESHRANAARCQPWDYEDHHEPKVPSLPFLVGGHDLGGYDEVNVATQARTITSPAANFAVSLRT